MRHPPFFKRFWDFVEWRPGDQCWPWRGTRDQSGYGTIWFERRNIRATRLMWALHNGEELPANLYACHTCDNPWCVNPAHLWVGTINDNNRDCASKGRFSQKQLRGLHASAVRMLQFSLAKLNYDPTRRRPNQFAQATHCPRGHAYAGQRSYPSDLARGRQRCRTCHDQRHREAVERKRTATAAARIHSN